MKKWKIYFPLVSFCGSLLVICIIWGIVRGSVWNGQMELRHLEGDESALADFTLKGKIEDSQNTWDFSIEDGKLEKNDFHMGAGMGTAYPVERISDTWKEGELEVWSSYGTFVPAADSQVETKDTVDLTVLKGNTHFPSDAYQEDGTLHGTTTVLTKGRQYFNWRYMPEPPAVLSTGSGITRFQRIWCIHRTNHWQKFVWKTEKHTRIPKAVNCG